RLLVGLAAQDVGRLFAQIPVAPLPQAGQREVEVAALLGQPVLVALGPLAVADPLEDACVDQPIEPVGEDVAGDPEALLELLEPAQAEEGVADDQERPALADDLERPRDRAVLPLVVTLQHAHSIASSLRHATISRRAALRPQR